MKRLIEDTVFSGLRIAWRLAICPTNRSPALVNPTTDGVSRPPSLLGMTCVSPPITTATTELVVPRSIPTTLPMVLLPLVFDCDRNGLWTHAFGLRDLHFQNALLEDSLRLVALDLV